MSLQNINPPTKRITRQSLKFALTSKERTEDAIPESVELRDRVFTNDVVWRIFSSCLSFSDLKACRLVSTNFNTKVLSSPRFKNHVEMKISTDDLRLRKFGKSSGAHWKHICVEIKPSQGKKDVERRWLDFALSDVTTLKLILPAGVMRYKSFHPPHQLWTSPKNLTKLTIDAQLLWDEKTFEKNGEVFSNLQELEIIRPCLYRQDEIGYISGREREMKALPALAPYLKNLKVLKIRTNMADSPDVDLWMPRSLVADMRSLLTIVHLNKNHLKELELDDSPLWSHTWEGESEALMNSVFPELNSLQVRLISKEAHTFIPFLKKQPLLQKLDLTVLGAIPADLFSNVKLRSDLLTALRLKGCGFSNSSASLCELLRSSKLKEFRLNSVKKGGVSANARREIIENLPPSIESIFLRASAEELRSNEIDPVIFERINPLMITQLTLIRCHEIVTDRTVEFFCRNFKLLQLLNLAFADERCTDFGFTGIRPSGNRESFTLSDLKGLRSLTLQQCGKITDLTLLEGIKFLELKYLDISENKQLTAKGVLSMLKNNPSLEVLRLSTMFAYTLPQVQELRKESNSRLKSIETVYSSSMERDEDDLSDSDLDVDNSSDDSSDAFDWGEGYDYESDSSDYNVCVVM